MAPPIGEGDGEGDGGGGGTGGGESGAAVPPVTPKVIGGSPYNPLVLHGRASHSATLAYISNVKGWDPTVIPGFGSITGWDTPQGPLGEFNSNLPKGAPTPDNSTYDQYGSSGGSSTAATPDVRREQPRYTVNANPYPGFDGGY